jgi:L-Ala-D/L-Glu epimerase
MQIKEIRVYKSEIKLKKPFIISLGSITHAKNIFLTITTEAGLTGFGECSPSLTINGESADTSFVMAAVLARALIGQNPLDIGHCSLLMDSVVFGNTSIKSAFDIAIHDIAARNAGLPLYKFLGGRSSSAIYTDYTVSLDDPSKMVADAIEIKKNGFPFIKVKLGDNRADDVTRIRLIARAIGDEIPLRLDANQGWDVKTAIGVLNDLAPYNIQFCEEPVPRWDYMSLPMVKSASPFPLMADESCLDHNDAARLIKIGACDYINIKTGKSSGLFKAVKIARVAADAGVKMMVGGFIESRLATTASAHFYLSNDHIVFSDFDSPLFMVDDPVTGGIVYGENGLVSVPEEAGLGARVDEGFLSNLPSVIINQNQ